MFILWSITVFTTLRNFNLFYSLSLGSKANVHSSLPNNVTDSTLFFSGNTLASKCLLLFSFLAALH